MSQGFFLGFETFISLYFKKAFSKWKSKSIELKVKVGNLSSCNLRDYLTNKCLIQDREFRPIKFDQCYFRDRSNLRKELLTDKTYRGLPYRTG